MLDADFLERKTNLIARDLDRLAEFDQLTYDEIAKDWRAFNTVERLLEMIITRAIDMNRHIIAEMGTGREKTYKHEETFIELGNLGVLDTAFATKIAPSAGLRNRLVHDYNGTDPKIVYKSAGEARQDFADYCDAILKFITKSAP